MIAPKVVKVGIIGAGLMGREAAMAIARWSSLLDHPIRPVLTAVCDTNAAALEWFRDIASITVSTADYRELLDAREVDVVYVAVRHDLHERMYIDAIDAGKDLLGEKPFGIDLQAAEAIVAAANETGSFVRCSSEIPFYPGAQMALRYLASHPIGDVIEVHSGFSHSSDLNRGKPISWKRQRRFCGDAGVMNDLGMHVLHVPLRLGWRPTSVFSVLQDLVPERPDASGSMVACDTYENATLFCEVPEAARTFPLLLTMKRIDPGQTNTWSLRVLGMEGGVEYSTRMPKSVRILEVNADAEQSWREVEAGSQSTFASITGAIFESGFSDAILQMWASFLAEREGLLGDRFGCVTPTEALDSHHIWAAAMRSANTRALESIDSIQTEA